MIQNRLKRIHKLVSNSAESFRGVDMDTYLALGKAAAAVDIAIAMAEKAARKESPPAVPLTKALFG